MLRVIIPIIHFTKENENVKSKEKTKRKMNLLKTKRKRKGFRFLYGFHSFECLFMLPLSTGMYSNNPLGHSKGLHYLRKVIFMVVTTYYMYASIYRIIIIFIEQHFVLFTHIHMLKCDDGKVLFCAAQHIQPLRIYFWPMLSQCRLTKDSKKIHAFYSTHSYRIIKVDYKIRQQTFICPRFNY